MRRHVLRSETADSGFLGRFRAILPKLQEKTGLRFVAAQHEDLSDDVRKYPFVESEKHGTLSVLDDLDTPTRWLEIEGDSEDFERTVDDAVLLLVEIVPLRQLRGEARKKADDVTLKRLARGAGEKADTETMEILASCLSSNDPARVYGAAKAAAILGWSELLPALDAAASIKRTSRVKHALRAALAACTK
ncbi:MAG: HEAT repeat domain-containing protein [Polyangiales bacterium]